MHTASRSRQFSKLGALVLLVPGLVLGGFALGGCPGTLDNPDQFKTGDGGTIQCFDVPTEFAKTCTGAGCHNAMEKTQMLDLESPNVEERLVNKPGTECGGVLIIPGMAEQSILYKKLTTPMCGLPMPSSPDPANPLPKYTAPQLGCIKT